LFVVVTASTNLRGSTAPLPFRSPSPVEFYVAIAAKSTDCTIDSAMSAHQNALRA
jgi:hypothetical protein